VSRLACETEPVAGGTGTAQQPAHGTDRRPDASMALLTQLAASSADDYGAAAASSAQPAGARRGPVLLGALVVTGLLLAIAVNQVRGTADAVSAERAALAERVQAESGRVQQLEGDVTGLRDDVRVLQQSTLRAQGQRIEALAAGLSAQVGTTEVTGPGLVVVLDDAEPLPDGSVPGAVLDVDLQRVVNGLWAAGAEAVAVGPERLTPLSAIRSANDIVLVNYTPLPPPYEIRAIGDPQALRSAVLTGPAGQWLAAVAASDGIRYTVRTVESTTLPAEPELTLRHAVPAGRGGPAPTPTATAPALP
jgi:uncharacterized protein YlxW (UPF0749 family)